MNKLDEIGEQVLDCRKCELRLSATAPVPGLGTKNAKYMIIGEAPGKDEDLRGVPFVGSAGRKLNQLMELAGIDENLCYITNVVKCRPPKNATPKKKMLKVCLPFLKQEIEEVKPEYIITLGATPLSLFTDTGIKNMHGCMFEWENPDTQRKHKIIAQYHPAAALHQPRLWAVMLNDWQFLPNKANTDFIALRPQTTSSSYPDTVALDTENDINGTLGAWSIVFREDGELMAEAYERAMPRKPTINSDVVMHNSKWDLRVLRRNGMKTLCPDPLKVHDTMVAAYCLGLGRQSPESANEQEDSMVGGLGLKYLTRRHLGMNMKTWQQVKDKPEEMLLYNIEDSLGTLLLWELWKPKLPEHYWNIDHPLTDVLMSMEDRGMKIDINAMLEYEKELSAKLEAFEFPFNPDSPKQLRKYLYEDQGIEPFRFTESKLPSTDAETLEVIDDPIIQDVLRFRGIRHERNTYAKNYIENLDVGGRIHCEFKQTRTATGRLSSANPNLQNVPRRSEDTKMRRMFIAKEGYSLIRADYEQLELYVFAALTQEPRMLKAAMNKESIHRATAESTGFSYDDAKTMNFQMLYGGSPYGLSQTFHITIDKAQEFRDRYFEKFPGIANYIIGQKELAKSAREVTLWTGRTRRLDAMYATDYRVRRSGEREAINTPIQGGAGEIVKLAMIDLHYKHSAPMICQVHDEIIFEVPDNEAMEYARWLKEYIPQITTLNGVQFPVSVGVGKNWKEASEKD